MRAWLLLAVLVCTSCSGGDSSWISAPQNWKDVSISIETEPAPVRQGMNEFILIANHQQRGFINDLLVMVRTESSDWEQAMPDGALGVFRRALPVQDIQHDHLYVRLTRRGEHGEMTFALAPKPR